MRRLLAIVLFATCLIRPALAATPSVESIDTLLDVTGARQLAVQMSDQAGQVLENINQELITEMQLDADQQKALRLYASKSLETIRTELSWEALRPGYVKLYQEVFTQDEIDQLIAFYRTPTCKMLTTKMPEVSKRTTAQIQERMSVIVPRLQAALAESVKQMQEDKAARKH